MEHSKRERHPLDRALIANIIDMQIPRTRDVWTKSGLWRASGLSRSTIDRALAGNPEVEASTFARIEGALHLPHLTLQTAGRHDVDGLVEMGAPSDIVRLVRKELDKVAGDSGRAVGD